MVCWGKLIKNIRNNKSENIKILEDVTRCSLNLAKEETARIWSKLDYANGDAFVFNQKPPFGPTNVDDDRNKSLSMGTITYDREAHWKYIDFSLLKGFIWETEKFHLDGDKLCRILPRTNLASADHLNDQPIDSCRDFRFKIRCSGT